MVAQPPAPRHGDFPRAGACRTHSRSAMPHLADHGGADLPDTARSWCAAAHFQHSRRETMRPIPPGTKGTSTFVVAPDHLASRFKDPTLPPVLATPMMILAMENAALAAIKPFLDRGESA